jgi:Flp pilus assembly pilin Flp
LQHRTAGGGEAGTTALEYALIAALIAVVIIVSLMFVSGNVQSLYKTVSTHVSTSSGS